MKRYAIAVLLVLIGTGAQCVPAQDYPNRALRLIVPSLPGGSVDILGRVAAQKLGERLGQQVVVENRAGAGGIIAVEFVAKSTPDGYTLIVGQGGNFVVAPHTFRKIPYDPIKDFAPSVAQFPDVPTLAETLPGYDSRGWFGFLAPAGTRREIVTLLNQEINRAIALPDVQEKLTAVGLMVVAEPPEYFAATIKSDYAKYGKLVRDIGLHPQ